MNKNFIGEKWKTVKFDFEFTNKLKLEVSNFGRVRSTNQYAPEGRILNGGLVNGYGVIRLNLYTPRDPKVQKRFDQLKKQTTVLAKKIKKMKEEGESKKVIKETEKQLATMQASLSEKYREELKSRCITHHFLTHRLVAEYFLKAPKKNQVVISHLDHNKLNNHVDNLRWMTKEENYAHRIQSPKLIEQMKNNRNNRLHPSSPTKLSIPQVMLLKKLLNEGKSMKLLIEQFKVTETQIYRIKRGENWGDIAPAK